MDNSQAKPQPDKPEYDIVEAVKGERPGTAGTLNGHAVMFFSLRAEALEKPTVE